MTNKIKKNLKPIEYDIHLKYVCPNKNCGYFHWLSLKETQTKNFKVVCDCGQVFSPLNINDIGINYRVIEKEKLITSQPIEEKVNNEIFVKCTKILKAYGFDEEESLNMINSEYQKNPTSDHLVLIKNSLSNLFGDNYGK